MVTPAEPRDTGGATPSDATPPGATPPGATPPGATPSDATPPCTAPDGASRVVAAWEVGGARVGLIVMVAGFLLYVTGLLPPWISLAELTEAWSLPVDAFVARTGAPTGWQWAARLGHGDMVGLAGLVVLTSVTGAAYLALAARLFRDRDRTYLVLVLLQVVVFVLAAGGWLAGH